MSRIRIIFSVLAVLACMPVMAQKESQDSLVVLMSSKSAQMVDVDGASYRKIVGPARFLHNGTYLLCDTAYWNVDSRVIDAWGNVSILQDETVLSSDKLTYRIDKDLAQFRGSVVQLTDKDHNTLRTRYLDYNTKDSVAVFMNGGSMRDKDGQIIESRRGTYDSKVGEFTFNEDVNMFTDSIFVKTDLLIYESESSLATFGSATDVWKDENMLSSEKGWYDREKELFFFTDDVHLMSEDQEGWCDSLYFRRLTSDVEMLGNAQVSDTVRNVFGLAGRIEYVDSLSRTTLTRNPAVISRMTEQDGSVDTVYLGADRMVYMVIPMFEVDSAAMEAARKRLKDLDVDPVGEYRKKAAEAAAKALEDAVENDPNLAAKRDAMLKRSGGKKPGMSDKPLEPLAVADSLTVTDSLAVTDSVAVAEAVAVDSTRIGFLEAIGNVKVFRKNMQVACDSLLYSDLDSLARFFKEPVIWQETVRQYAADSISLAVNGGAMQKASLMSNAFVTLQQDTSHYNQIKGTEMLAFFGDQGSLDRFDVLGGASSLFYVEENGVLATVNKTESKMLSAIFKDGNIQRIYYYDQPKNDGYPKVQLSMEERNLKGFNWQPDRRPADRDAVTPLSLRPSQRQAYAVRPHAQFRQTDIYFPGYIGDINRQIEVRDSLRRIRDEERRLAQASEDKKTRPDSLALRDSLVLADTLAKTDSLKLVSKADSLAMSDSLKVAKDALSKADTTAVQVKELTAKEKKAALRAEKKRKKKEAKEKRWAELDRRDAEKAKAKEEKRLARERKRKRSALEAAAREAEKDARVLEAYIEKYRRQKEKEESR